ncbi:MAG: hypothetical protein JXR97_13340 [Planctomycetes bacterium]|nr:hypothetical protein [Planctomycetota bacterium]
MSADDQGRKPAEGTGMRRKSFTAEGKAGASPVRRVRPAMNKSAAEPELTPLDGNEPGTMMKKSAGKASSTLCPCCSQSVGTGDVICTNCGYNLKMGTQTATSVPGGGNSYRRGSSESSVSKAAKVAGKVGVAAGVGFAVAFVCGLIWAAIASSTGYEFGILAWGVGVVTGFAVTCMTPERSGRVGVIASGLAVFGILIGKIMVISWSSGAVAGEIMKDPASAGAYRYGVISDMLANDEIDEDIKFYYEFEVGLINGNASFEDLLDKQEQLGEEQEAKTEKLEAEIENRIKGLSPGKRREYAERAAEKILAKVSYGDMLKASMGFYDILWIVLAVCSAFKIGAGMQD